MLIFTEGVCCLSNSVSPTIRSCGHKEMCGCICCLRNCRRFTACSWFHRCILEISTGNTCIEPILSGVSGLWLFDPMVVHAKLSIPTRIHAFSLQTVADVLIIPTPVSDCWWRWSFYAGIKSFSGAMIEELLDGKDGEGHLSAVFMRVYQPIEDKKQC